MSKRRLKRDRRAILDGRERLFKLRASVDAVATYVNINIADSSSSKARMLEDLAAVRGMVVMDLAHNHEILTAIETEIGTPMWEARMRDAFEPKDPA